MSITSILLVSLSLCPDNFAITVAAGCSGQSFSARTVIKVSLAFALAHIIMLSCGWYGGAALKAFVGTYGHCLSFLLLSFIGGKMLKEALKKGEERRRGYDLSSLCNLLLLALASSLDASALGVALSLENIPLLALAATMAACVLATSAAGFTVGRRLGCKYGKFMEFAGGAVLIGLGIKFLSEGL
jgi:putative Mn2+ efflux pump MntP